MNIAVIGTGYVGLISGTCFAEAGHRVTCCDTDQMKIKELSNGVLPIVEPGLQELVEKNMRTSNLQFTDHIGPSIREADVVYIAVGTPMQPSGQADLTYVFQVAETIGENLNKYKIIVTKSTVPVGTGKEIESRIQKFSKDIPFDMVSNPEFLREGSAIKDSMHMERAVIGTTSEKAFQIISELHQPFTSTILKTTIETAELIKYASNTFLATKISFINDIANLCELVGADVTEVSEGMGLDSRIGPKFLQAGVGFGGSCFPKDTAALLNTAKAKGYDFKLIQAVMETNEHQRQLLVNKLVSVFGSLKNKTISVLGLAFKPGTNDVRSSPALDIIPILTEMGAKVIAYDPFAVKEAKKMLGLQCSYSNKLDEALQNTDACMILTDWQQVKEMDLNNVKRVMNRPIIVDGRNLFKLNTMAALGFTYLSVGRQAVLQGTEISSVF